MVQNQPLRIAIIGGGLAGAAAASTLSRLPNVQIKVYERAPVVREAGAQIAVMVTALKVLRRMLSPKAWDYLQSMLYRGEGTDGIHHRHWRTGEILSAAVSPDTPRHMQEGRVSRVSLHRTLMIDVPDGVFEYASEVLKIETMARGNQKEVHLHLMNGDTRTADLVVVADGLYSKIRRQYLPETDVQYKGLVAYRINFPVSRLAHITDLPDDSSSFRKGPNVVILSRLEPGTYSLAAFLQEPEEFANSLRWEHALGQAGIDRIKQKLAGWHPLIHKVLDALPGNIDAYPLQGTKWMEQLIRDDSVAFVGDAAHPTAGGWGTGSAFCFADVWTLYRSLNRTYRPTDTSAAAAVPYDIPYSLHLFNESRRHFLQRVERQFDYDKIDTKYVSEALEGGDDAEFVRRYRERYTSISWILEHDADARWQEVEARERHRYSQRQSRL